MSDPPERPRPSKLEMVMDLIRERLLTLVGIGLLVIGAAAYFGLDVQLSRGQRLVAWSVVFTAPYAWIFGMWFVGWFWEPTIVYLIDVDARDPEDGALYRLPLEEFQDLEVAEGDLEQWAPRLYAGKNVDVDDWYAVGTWRGSATDRELLAHLPAVYLVRNELEPRARKWDRLAPQLPWLIRQEARDEAAFMLESLEDLVLPSAVDGGSARERLEEQLEDEEERDDHVEELRAEDVDELADVREELVDDLDLDADPDGMEGLGDD